MGGGGRSRQSGEKEEKSQIGFLFFVVVERLFPTKRVWKYRLVVYAPATFSDPIKDKSIIREIGSSVIRRLS